MSLQQYSKEELQEMSLIEIAHELLAEKKQTVSFQELMEEVAKTVGMSDEEVKKKIAQFYTDLNIDGRFLALGDNKWGLRIWYPVDQVVEEIVNPVKAKKKKKAKKAVEDEDLDVDDFDLEDEFDEEEIFDEEDEIDDLDDLDDEDDLLEDDLEEDLDDDLLEDDLDEDEFEDEDEDEEELDDEDDSDSKEK